MGALPVVVGTEGEIGIGSSAERPLLRVEKDDLGVASACGPFDTGDLSIVPDPWSNRGILLLVGTEESSGCCCCC